MASIDQHIVNYNTMYTKENDKKNIISLYNLLRGFILLNHTFVREYKHLPEINLGKKVCVEAYDSLANEENNRSIRALTLSIYEPTFTEAGHVFMYLTEVKNSDSSINYKCCYDKDNHEICNLNIDSAVIKKYLDFFEGNIELVDLYFALSETKKDKTISITCTNGECQNNTILEILSEFCVKINICDANNSQDSLYAEIYVDDKLRFNLLRSKLIMGGRNLQISAELFKYILNRINIGGEYLIRRESMTQEKGKDIISMLQRVTKEVKK